MAIKQIDNVYFTIEVDSGNQSMVDDPKAELLRILDNLKSKIENVDFEIGDSERILDLNGNNIGSWDLTIDATEYPDHQETIDEFKDEIREGGFVVGECTYRTLCEAAEADYHALNEYWNNWIDGRIQMGELPAEANGWDWES